MGLNLNVNALAAEINPDTGITPVKSNQNIKNDEQGGISPSVFDVMINPSSGGLMSGADVGVDIDKYKPYTGDVNIFRQDIDEIRALEQSNWEQASRGLGNFLNTGLGEIAKMPGYLSGGIDFLRKGIGEGEWDIETATNNAWIQGITELQNDLKDNELAIYKSEKLKDNFLANLASPAFWASDFADGLGFFASMLVPGALLKVGKFGVWGAKLFKNASNMKKLAAGIDVGAATAVNTLFESAAETGNFIDNMKNEYKQYKQQDGTYKVPDHTSESGFTILNQGQVDDIIGSAGKNVFKTNVGILLGPNLLMSKALFGRMAPKKSNVARFGKTLEEVKKPVGTISRGERTSNILSKAGKGMLSEGAFEEGLQFATEDYYGAKARLENDENFIKGITDSYIKGLSGVEMQKSMFIGALLGGGANTRAAIQQNKADQKNLSDLSEQLQKAPKKIQEVINAFELVDGKLILKPDALKQGLANNMELAKDLVVFQTALESGNNGTALAASDRLLYQFISGYLEVEGGMELMAEHLDEMATPLYEMLAESGSLTISKEEFMKRTMENAKDLQSQYDLIRNNGPEFFGISKPNVQSKEEQAKIDEAHTKFMNDIINSALYNTIESKRVSEDLDTVNKEIAKHTGKDTPVDKAAVQQYEERKLELDKRKVELQEQFDLFFNEAEQQKAFQEKIDMLDEKKAADINLKKKQEKLQEFTETLQKNLTAKGYKGSKVAGGVSGGTFVKDNDGNHYRITRGRKHDQEGGNQYYFKDLQDGTLTPYTLKKAMELGLDNIDNILTSQEGKAKEKELRNKPKPDKEPPLVTDDIEQDPSTTEQYNPNSAKKINPFSTMSSLYKNKKKLELNPNGERWSRFWSSIDKSTAQKYEALIVNREDLEKQEGKIKKSELPPKSEADQLYAVMYKGGKPVTNSEGELIYAGIAKTETIDKNDTVPIDKYIVLNELDKDGNPIDPSKITDKLRKKTKAKIVKEYKIWRGSLVSNQLMSVTRLSPGIPQFSDDVVMASERLKGAEIFIPTTGVDNFGNGDINVSKGYVYAKTKEGNVVRLDNILISKHPNSESIIGAVIELLGYANQMESNSDDVVLTDGSTTKLFSTNGQAGLLSKIIRMGESRNGKKPFDMKIAGQEGGKSFIYVDEKGKSKSILINSFITSDGKMVEGTNLQLVKKALANKFMHVDLSTLNEGGKVKIPTRVNFETNEVGFVEYNSYSEYVLANALETRLVKKDNPIPQFGNQYFELDKDKGQYEKGKIVKKKVKKKKTKTKNKIKQATDIKVNETYISRYVMSNGEIVITKPMKVTEGRRGRYNRVDASDHPLLAEITMQYAKTGDLASSIAEGVEDSGQLSSAEFYTTDAFNQMNANSSGTNKDNVC